MRILSRLNDVFHKPIEAFENFDTEHDLGFSLSLVFLTPFVASLSKFSHGYDSGIQYLLIQIFSNLVMWIGMAGLIETFFSFQGIHFSIKSSMVLAGLSWAPRLIGALLSACYEMNLQAWNGGTFDFSSGISLIPGLPNNTWIRTMGNISVFDVWGAWLIVFGSRILSEEHEAGQSWTLSSLGAFFAYIFLGLLTSY